MRIISAVPSITELLSDLNLEEEVVGITKFCVHPEEWFRSKPRIGGTKNLNIEKIRSLNPDWFIANKEENVKAQIEEITTFTNVYVSEIKTLEDNIGLIEKMGEISERQKVAENLVMEMNKLIKTPFKKQKYTIAYCIWNKPMMFAGVDTFINTMIEFLGFENKFSAHNRYPEIESSALTKNPPDIIFLSSEPFPFKDKHLKAFKDLCPTSLIYLVDGEVFSWYGSHFIKSKTYLQELSKKLSSDLELFNKQ